MEPLEQRRDIFCSWEEEEEDLDSDMHSPTDASEDSIDVKVKPISGLMGGCNKRKSVEHTIKYDEEANTRLLNARTQLEAEVNPFRPWSQPTPSGFSPRDQDEPLSLVMRDELPSQDKEVRHPPVVSPSLHAKSRPRPPVLVESSTVNPFQKLSCSNHAKSRPRPQEVQLSPLKTVTVSVKPEFSAVDCVQEVDCSEKIRTFSVESLISERPGTSSSTPSTSKSFESDKRKQTVYQAQQRNYKNMTRERRVEANARERTRVHTISAAFDTLRRAVPAYSHNQKLSKLSVLRIACSYILTLSRVTGCDYSADNSQPSLGECVDQVTHTIQLEGKLRKKKED